jgi:DNA-nicking Smr family endonuclease
MTDPNDPDRALFRQALAGVRRLRQDRVVTTRTRPRPVPKQTLRAAREVMDNLLSDAYDPYEIELGEELLYVRPGVPQRAWRHFRRGHYAIEAELDLHGHTVPQARERVVEFLRRAQLHGRRCVRIIHGKGHSSAGRIPVLKGKVNGWLRRMDAVLGFCSARPNDGGTGAVYVLLKRP